MTTATAVRPISTVAREILKVWGPKVNFAAKPYLQAMLNLNSASDSYGHDSAKSVVTYFLGNASTFRGEDAKRLKTELKSICGIK
jgi:hypothetical protein